MSIIRKELSGLLTLTPAPDGGGFAAEFTPPPHFAAFQGHFEGNPIVPGVCLVAAVIVGAEKTLSMRLKLSRLGACKFLSPVLPNDRVTVQATVTCQEAEHQIKAQLSCGSRRVASLSVFVTASA